MRVQLFQDEVESLDDGKKNVKLKLQVQDKHWTTFKVWGRTSERCKQ